MCVCLYLEETDGTRALRKVLTTTDEEEGIKWSEKKTEIERKRKRFIRHMSPEKRQHRDRYNNPQEHYYYYYYSK